MQFLAFLKDSYREARSGWVLQAMLVLAALLVLFVFSVSFTPTTVRADLDQAFGIFNWALRQNPETAGTQFLVENYSETNPAEPWKSDYAFDFVVKAPSEAGMKKLQDGRGLPVSRARAEKFFRDALGYLDNVEVAKGPEGPAERRFRVTTRGTKTPDALSWRHVPKVLFAFEVPLLTTSLRGGVYTLENYLVSGIGAWVILFISVVITAGFIPTLLQKGALDLALAKPIRRPVLLLYKYVGGLTFMVLLTAFTVGGAWVALGVRTGLWSPNFLLVIPILTFYFAVLYAVSTLASVLTRSTIVTILATLLAWGGFWLVGKVNAGIANRLDAEAKQDDKPLTLPKPGDEAEPPDPDDILRRIDPDAPLWGFIPKSTFPVLKALQFVTPRTYQLDSRLGRVIAEGVLTDDELKRARLDTPAKESWAELLGVSGAFIAAVLGLAVWRFSTRDG